MLYHEVYPIQGLSKSYVGNMERAFSRSILNKKTKPSKVPWITTEIKGLKNEKDKLKIEAIIAKLETDWSKCQRTRNQVNIKLRNTKTNYYSSKIFNQKYNPKKAWRSINNLLGKQNKNSKIN